MILNVSSRTDIVAFYTPWFINRYRSGYVDVRNPFNENLISRINFSDVDAILFCTKNPTPILNYIKEINKPIIFHVTITPYKSDIEPNVPPKKEIINSVKKLSKLISKDNIFIRYDPIFISSKYSVDYHIKAFNKLCTLLNGYVNKIIISFLDEYKNTLHNKNILKYQKVTKENIKVLATSFSKIAKQNNMTIQTCCEDSLEEYGFIKDYCLSHEFAYILTGKKYPNWKARGNKSCMCVQMVDIGSYNTCRHLCKYCYANYDEEKVSKNILKHNPNSSLLIGDIKKDDIIKIRKK